MSHKKKRKASKVSNKAPKILEKPPPLPIMAEEPVRDVLEETENELDLYAREAILAIDSLRGWFPLIPSSFFDIAQTNTVEFVRMQMRIFDLMINHSQNYLRDSGEVERAA